MKTLNLSLCLFAMGISAFVSGAAVAAPGVCAFDSLPKHVHAVSRRGSECATSPNETIAEVKGELSLRFNGQPVRSYQAVLPYRGLLAACREMDDLDWNYWYGQALYKGVVQQMQADCDKLAAIGTCVCLGTDIDKSGA